MSRISGNVPSEAVGIATLPRHDQKILTPLHGLSDVSSTVADALDELGRGAVISRMKLGPLWETGPTIGQAVTLEYRPLPGDAATNRERDLGTVLGDRDLYGFAEPGDLAVIAASEIPDAAVMGGISAAWAAKAGVGGCIIDGLIRDSDSIRREGVPVWSAGRSSRAARYRVAIQSLNKPVVIAGATVCPGDYIVADNDGIAIIPFDDVPAVVELAQQAQQEETVLLTHVQEAISLEDLVYRTRDAKYL